MVHTEPVEPDTIRYSGNVVAQPVVADHAQAIVGQQDAGKEKNHDISILPPESSQL